MAEEEGEVFEKADAGSSHTAPIQCGNLHKGDYVMLKDHPCRVMEITSAKTGKHGHAKAAITGLDIFSHKKYEDSCPTSHSIDAPIVTRKEYQLSDISPDGYVTLLLESGGTKEDLTLPKEEEDQVWVAKLKASAEEGKNIIIGVMSAMGIEKVVDFKEI